jgi:hypothetical protein
MTAPTNSKLDEAIAKTECLLSVIQAQTGERIYGVSVGVHAPDLRTLIAAAKALKELVEAEINYDEAIDFRDAEACELAFDLKRTAWSTARTLVHAQKDTPHD